MIALQGEIEALAATIFAAAVDCHAHDAVSKRSIGLALADATNLGRNKCSRIVNRASVLVHLLPMVHAAYAAGEMNTDQIQAVRFAHSPSCSPNPEG